MANKPEFVDTIGEATRQRWRRTEKRAVEAPVAEVRSRLSHWPPKQLIEWKLETFTPWRIKAWRNRTSGS
jgi:hypothetical protein